MDAAYSLNRQRIMDKGWLLDKAGVFLIAVMMVLSAAQAKAEVITVGSAGTLSGGIVSLPVTVDVSENIGGAVFTLSYNSTYLTLTDIQSPFFSTFTSQWLSLEFPSDPLPPGEVTVNSKTYNRPLRYEGSGGSTLVAAARVKAGMTETTLFTLEFDVAPGTPEGTYPVVITATSLNNTAAGYPSGGASLPILVGIVDGGKGERDSYPPLSASVVNGLIGVGDVTLTYNVIPGLDDEDCSDGKCNLQAALDRAGDNGNIDMELHLQQGTYNGNFVYQPTTGNNGDLAILGGYSTDFSTQDADPTNTVIDGLNIGQGLILNPGIAAGITSVSGSLRVEGITVKNGEAAPETGGIGGGILALTHPPGIIEISNTIIENNHAAVTGGGCAVAVWEFGSENGGDVQFNNNIIRNNSVFQDGAVDGNGGGCSFIVTGATSLTNNLVYGNSVGDTATYNTPDGGGLDFDLLAGTLIMTNNTIVDNSVLSTADIGSTANGGGISLGTSNSDAWGASTVEVANTIIYSNSVSTGIGEDINNRVIATGNTVGSTFSISYSDYASIHNSTDTDTVIPVTNSNINNSPLFSTQPSSLYYLTYSSPCIDSADNSATSMPLIDLAGTTRPQDNDGDLTATTNMGCYEEIMHSYTVTVLAGDNGTLNSTTPSPVIIESGGSATFTFDANANYHIASIIGCGIDYSNSSNGVSSYTVETDLVIANCAVNATFAINQYTVTATAGDNGTLNPTTPSPVNVESGGSTIFTFDANTNYHITSITGCGINYSNSSNDVNSYTAETDMVIANCAVNATFAINQYTVTATAGDNGTLNPGTPSPVIAESGGSATFTFDADANYHIASITGCGIDYSNSNNVVNSYTAETDLVITDCAVNATFAINQYTVTAITGDSGTLNPGTPSPVIVESGGSATFTFDADANYHIASIVGCGIDYSNSSNGVNSYTVEIDQVIAACTVNATFNIDTYSLNYTAGENGSINGAASQTVTHGSNGTTISAVANDNYHFVSWSDGATENPRTDTYITTSVSVTANFSIGNIISGTVSLPGSAVAPPEGISLNIYADNQNGNEQAYSFVTIKTGESSAQYSLIIPPEENAEWVVSYHYFSNQYLADGYYSSTGTQWEFDQATALAGKRNHSSIDLSLLVGNTISGTISLPSGIAPAGGVAVQVSSSNQSGSGWASVLVLIPEGSSSASYSLTTPQDADIDWVVEYFCDMWTTPEACAGYLQSGYYSTSGTQWDFNQAAILSGSESHALVNLMLLTGNIISGTVSLPDGHTAPEGGVAIYVSSTNKNGSGWGSDSVQIPEGSSSVAYSLTVPIDIDISWVVDYSCDQWLSPEACAEYLPVGYYSTSGTQWIFNLATTIDGGTDQSQVNLSLLIGHTISGTVALPEGVAPAGGIALQVSTSNQNGSGEVSTSVLIPEGASSVPYSLLTPISTDINWIVAYSCDQWYTPEACAEYLPVGYYSSNGTQWDFRLLTTLAGDSNHSSVDLTLLSGNRISGTLLLPDGQVAPAGGLSGRIDVMNPSLPEVVFSTDFYIFEGDSSTAYSLLVTPDIHSDWIAYYSYWQDDSYVPTGYYSVDGTQLNSSMATTIIGGSDYFDINFTLLTGTTNSISGTIALPSGETSSVGGTWVYITAVDQNGGGTAYIDIEIPEGSSSAPYSLSITPDVDARWQVFYSYWGMGSYLPNGYYDASGTQPNPNNITLLNGGLDHYNVALTLLVENNYHTVTHSIAVGNGAISPTSQFVNQNDYAVFTFTPNAGYFVLETVGGTCPLGIFTDNGNGSYTYSTGQIAGDCNLIASFEKNTYALIYIEGENGTIAGANEQSVNYRENGSVVMAVPANGFHFVQWSDGSTDNPRTDMNVTANINVTAIFSVNTYTVTASVTGGNGTIDSVDKYTVNEGDVAHFTLTPQSGYEPVISGSCGGSLSENMYTTSLITYDCDIIVRFKKRNVWTLFLPVIIGAAK